MDGSIMERKTSTNLVSVQLCYPCYSLEELLLMGGIWFSHCDMRMLEHLKFHVRVSCYP